MRPDRTRSVPHVLARDPEYRFLLAQLARPAYRQWVHRNPLRMEPSVIPIDAARALRSYMKSKDADYDFAHTVGRRYRLGRQPSSFILYTLKQAKTKYAVYFVRNNTAAHWQLLGDIWGLESL